MILSKISRHHQLKHFRSSWKNVMFVMLDGRKQVFYIGQLKNEIRDENILGFNVVIIDRPQRQKK